MDAHFFIVTTGSAGDLFPFLKLAAGLHARGHPLTVVAPALHEDVVRRAGLPFHGSFADAAVLDDPDLWHPRRGFGVVWRAVQPGLRELAPLVARLPAGQPCVIVAHPLALPAAELCHTQERPLRVVAAYLAPSNIPTVHDPLVLGPVPVPRWVPHGLRRLLWRQIAQRYIDPVALPDINAERVAAGLAPVHSLFAFMKSAPDLSLTLFPAWFARRQPDWPEPLLGGDFPLYDPDPDAVMAPALAAFLAQGTAPIVFTHGTGNRQARGFFGHALAASQRLGRRAIFLTPDRGQLPPQLPPEVLWHDYLPLQQLLPHALALVHHGGIGTTAEALRAGIPQLIVPLAFDQFDNAARVVALGAGLSVPYARLSSQRLAARLRKLLGSPLFGIQADALSTELRPPSTLDPLLDALSKLI